MRFSPIVSALLASTAVSGFAPSLFARVGPRMTSLFEKDSTSLDVGLGDVTLTYEPTAVRKDLPEVLKGYHLPEGKVPKPINNEFVDKAVTGFAGNILTNVDTYLLPYPLVSPKGSLKLCQDIQAHTNFYKEGMALAYAEFKKMAPQYNVSAQIVPDPQEAADYKFFGGSNYMKNLIELIKVNPFFTSALTKTKDGYKLISFENETKVEKNLYTRMTDTLTSPGHRVNIEFTSEMKYKSFQVFDDITGTELNIDETDEQIQKWASSAIYNMLFYVSCQHSMIHVLHYFMTSAFQYVGNENDLPEMSAWAETYASNIAAKYKQVAELLIADPAPIPATALLRPEAVAAVIGGSYALLTGPLGFGSTQNIRPLLAEVLETFAQNPKASSFLNATIGHLKLEHNDTTFLPQFKKHLELIKGFAKDAAQVLDIEDADNKAEEELVEYLGECGKFNTSVSGFQDWIELMATTGAVHGCTLSYTRLVSDGAVLRWRNINSPVWDTGDMNLLFAGLGTINGREDGRHVMGGGEFFPSDKKAPYIKDVLKKWDASATELKVNHTIELFQKDRKEFNEFGFIWSDFCPDGFDGKQETMASYI